MNQDQEHKEHLPDQKNTTPAKSDLSAEVAELEPELEDDGTEEAKEAKDDWFEQQEFVADPKQSLVRLDKFLMDRLSNRSRSKVQNAIRAGSVKVDNEDVKPNYKVKPGDLISLVLPKSIDDVQGVDAQDIPLQIVYEDADVMVVNKPYNMAVHPGVGIPNGTLVNAVAWHLREQADELPIKAGNEEIGIAHV